jgi:hypothetical protein
MVKALALPDGVLGRRHREFCRGRLAVSPTFLIARQRAHDLCRSLLGLAELEEIRENPHVGQVQVGPHGFR